MICYILFKPSTFRKDEGNFVYVPVSVVWIQKVLDGSKNIPFKFQKTFHKKEIRRKRAKPKNFGQNI